MSRKLFAFLLSEIKKVRLLCKNPACGGVAEVNIATLSAGYSVCPFCRQPFKSGDDQKPAESLALLGHAILQAQSVARLVDVEFILPDPSDDKTATQR